MDERDYIELALRCASAAVAEGGEQTEVYLAASKRLSVSVNGGEVERLVQANPIGLGLRVVKEHRQGFAFSSDFRQDSIVALARKAVFLASRGTPDEAIGLPEAIGSATPYEKLEIYDSDTAAVSPDKAISRAMEMEKAAHGYDSRVKSTQTCTFSAGEELVVIADHRGAVCHYRSTGAALMAGVVAQQEAGSMHSGSYLCAARSLEGLESPEDVGREAARRAVSLLGAKSVKTARVPVVMSPEVAASWISNIFYCLDGEETLKNTSFLSDKLGQAIGSSLVTIVDDGTRPRGVASRPFDGEGVPTGRNVLIEKGLCRGFVYNTYSARRAKTISTGNAWRGYDSPPGIGHHNLYLEPGQDAPEEIIAGVSEGFYVMTTGAFGFNPNTGDYSYEATGLWIKDGSLSFPVHEVTIASNSLDMLAGITAVGNDLKFRAPASSPTVRIAEMAVSGRSG